MRSKALKKLADHEEAHSVPYWVTQVESCQSGGNLKRLKNTWEFIQAEAEKMPFNDKNDSEMVRLSDIMRQLFIEENDPLSSLMILIKLGIYPPPEILLSLHARFETFKEFEGELTLEDCLARPPKQKSGGLAKRTNREWTRTYVNLKMNILRKEGLTVEEASEVIEGELPGVLSAETIARYARQEE